LSVDALPKHAPSGAFVPMYSMSDIVFCFLLLDRSSGAAGYVAAPQD
jgi:hypothetical protein